MKPIINMQILVAVNMHLSFVSCICQPWCSSRKKTNNKKKKNAWMSSSRVWILDDFAVPQPSMTVFCTRLSFCQGERGLSGLPGEPGEKGEPGKGDVGSPVSMSIYRFACLQHLLFSSTCNEKSGVRLSKRGRRHWIWGSSLAKDPFRVEWVACSI